MPAGDLQPVLLPDETLVELRPGKLKLIQSRKGYRFSLDPVLLSAFARIGGGDRVVDLGTGAGVIPLLLAARTGALQITGVEIQPKLADLARRNVALNRLEARVKIVEGDLRLLSGELPAQSFESVLANPPYRRTGTGRKAPDPERAAARHETAGGLRDFLEAACRLLKDGGRFYIVYLPERLAELLAVMREVCLEPKRMRCIHSRQGEEARLVLVEGRKRSGAGLVVAPPLYIYDADGYTAEIREIYGD